MSQFKSKEEYARWKAQKAMEASEMKQVHGSAPKSNKAGASGNESPKDKATLWHNKSLAIILLVLGLLGGIAGTMIFMNVSSSKVPAKQVLQNNAIQEPTRQFDASKFNGLTRASKKIEAALGVSVTYQEFGSLLQNFATELLVAKNKMTTDREKALFTQYTSLFDTYKDSHLFWQYKIQEAERWGVSESAAVLIKVTPDMAPLRELISKYNIPEEKYATPRNSGIPPYSEIKADSIQTIWGKAQEEGEKIDAALQQAAQ